MRQKLRWNKKPVALGKCRVQGAQSSGFGAWGFGVQSAEFRVKSAKKTRRLRGLGSQLETACLFARWHAAWCTWPFFLDPVPGRRAVLYALWLEWRSLHSIALPCHAMRYCRRLGGYRREKCFGSVFSMFVGFWRRVKSAFFPLGPQRVFFAFCLLPSATSIFRSLFLHFDGLIGEHCSLTLHECEGHK